MSKVTKSRLALMPLRIFPSFSIFTWTFLAISQSPGQELPLWAFGTYTFWMTTNMSRTRLSFTYPILYFLDKSCQQLLQKEWNLWGEFFFFNC